MLEGIHKKDILKVKNKLLPIILMTTEQQSITEIIYRYRFLSSPTSKNQLYKSALFYKKYISTFICA